MADLSIADVSIVLQQGVWVGVIQHGPGGVVPSTVCDPIGKQHIVKLHAKPCQFSQSSSCNLHAYKVQGPSFGVAYVVNTLVSMSEHTLHLWLPQLAAWSQYCASFSAVCFLPSCRFAPVHSCSPEKRHTCMQVLQTLAPFIAIAATSFTHGVFALVADSYMPCSCRNAVLYIHLVMHLCGCSVPRTKQ